MTGERVITDADMVALRERLGADLTAWYEALPPLVDTPPDPGPPVQLAPQNPVATPGDGKVVVAWAPPATGQQPTGYRYGRDGTDAAGSGPWSGTLPPTARSATLDKLVNGLPYKVTLAAVYPDGDVALTITVTPEGPPSPPVPDPPVAGAGRVKLAGLSGLPFNSIVFLAGSVSKAGMEQFGRERGRPLDGVLTFPPRNSWGALRQTPVAELKAILDAGGIVVYSIPHAPVPTDGNGEFTADAVAINVRGANDAYRNEQRAFGTWLADVGLNREGFILRPDWEFNGDWYPWSAKNGGPEAVKASLRNLITNVRAGGATKVRNDLCENKLPSQSGSSIPEVMPGPEYIDVLGIDFYDMWGPSFTPAQWAEQLRKGLAQNIDLAKKLGIQWSIDECGNTHPADKNHGGDNPKYWEFLLGTVRAETNSCAWHNTYLHPGAPASLRHDFASNPQSFATYKRLLAK